MTKTFLRRQTYRILHNCLFEIQNMLRNTSKRSNIYVSVLFNLLNKSGISDNMGDMQHYLIE